MTRRLALITVLALSAVAPDAFFAPAQAAEQFSREVGLPMQEARKAIDGRQWDGAVAAIRKAQAVPARSPYEDYQINEMLAYVQQTQRQDYPAAARAYEANLESGRVPAEQMAVKLQAVTQMYAQAHSWPKAIEYGNRWIKASPRDARAYEHVATAYFGSGDFRAAGRNIERAIDLTSKAGKTPDKNWLQLKRNCHHKLGEDAGKAQSEEQLLRYYPSPDHWKVVLGNAQKDSGKAGSDERVALNTYRLKLELGLLESKDYLDMAQLAIATGAAGEAVGVMEKGFASKTLDQKHERNQRLLGNARNGARAVPAEIARLEREAKASAAGETDVVLGSQYLSAGEYQKAITAIQRGLKKGGLKSTDDAHMMMGRAYLRLGKNAQAKEAFGAVPDDSRLGKIALLWQMYAAQS